MPHRIESTATRAAALLSGAATTTQAIRALSVAIAELASDAECPVQAAIASALAELADAHEPAEEATL